MKRNYYKVTVIIVLIILLTVFPGCSTVLKGEQNRYHAPFSSEDVASVTILDYWNRYKLIEDPDGIQWMFEKIDGIQLGPVYDPVKDEPAAGNYGHRILFALNDGTQYTFSACPLSVRYACFTDETGMTYKVPYFRSARIWNQLDYEVQEMEPLA